jgi:hypothetical protein
MAIRKWNLMGTSELAEAPFRSLQEVDEYLQNQVKEKLDELDGLLRQFQLQFSRTAVKSATEFRINKDTLKDGKIVNPKAPGRFKAMKLDKVSMPDMKGLAESFKVVEELGDKLEELDTLYNSISLKFKGVRGLDVTLKGIKEMKTQAQAKLTKALEFLKKVGQDHAPAPFVTLVEEAMTKILLGIEYAKISQSVYAYGNDKGGFTFCYYVEFTGLRDQDGGVFPKFYVVFTCVMSAMATDKDKLDIKYYATTMHSFESPGKYDMGKRVDDADRAAQAVSIFLDLENIGTNFGTLPHGLSPDEWTKSKFAMVQAVDKVVVDETSFTFVFDKNIAEDDFKNATLALYKEMRKVFSHINKAKIKVFQSPAGKTPKQVKFALTNLAEGDKVSVNDLDFLRDNLRVDEDKLRKITKIINSD